MSSLENSGKIIDKTNSRLNNRTCCCVPGCRTSARNEDVSFHKFPRRGNTTIVRSDGFGNAIREDRRTAWERALKLTRPASIYVRVCEKHFTPEDYIPGTSKKKHLRSTAIPSRNLPRMPPEMYKRKRLFYRDCKRTNRATNLKNKKVTEPKKLATPIEIIDLESDTESIEGNVKNGEGEEYVDGVEEGVEEEIESVFVKQQISEDDNIDFENFDEDDGDVIEVVPFFS